MKGSSNKNCYADGYRRQRYVREYLWFHIRADSRETLILWQARILHQQKRHCRPYLEEFFILSGVNWRSLWLDGAEEVGLLNCIKPQSSSARVTQEPSSRSAFEESGLTSADSRLQLDPEIALSGGPAPLFQSCRRCVETSGKRNRGHFYQPRESVSSFISRPSQSSGHSAARIADSSSRKALSFSSASETKRFPSPRCASAIPVLFARWNQSLR